MDASCSSASVCVFIMLCILGRLLNQPWCVIHLDRIALFTGFMMHDLLGNQTIYSNASLARIDSGPWGAWCLGW
jgi:hypothetical protein